MNKKAAIPKKIMDWMGTRTVYTAYYIVIIVLVFGVLLRNYSAPQNEVANLSNSWTDEAGAAVSLADFNAYDSAAGTMLPQRVYYTPEQVDADSAIIFRARSCYVNVYVNDELVHEDYRAAISIYGVSPGSRWHVVSFGTSDETPTICLEVTACYTNSDGLIDNIYLGSTHDVYRKAATKGIVDFIVGSFLQILGLIIIVLYFYMRSHNKSGRDLLYLGTATFFSAQWSSMESLLWQLFLGHSEVFHLLEYMALACIPLSFNMLASYRLTGKQRIYSMIFSIISAVSLIVLTALHIFGILEFHYSLIVMHVLVAFLIPLMIPLVLSYTDSRSKRKNGLVIFPLLGVLVACIATSIVKYNLGEYGSYSSYIRIALLCFVFCLIIYQFNHIVTTFSKGMKADMLHNLALMDHMTGLYNRTALNEHIPEYNHTIDSFSPLGVIQFDVNNLKKVNDTLGHEKGDQMIMAVAEGLRRAFDEFGDVCFSYRTGGDEFLTIINSINADEIYHTCIARLMEYCDNFNKQPDLDFTLTVAHGYVLTKGNTTLSEAIDEADVLMYENKRMLKGLK